MSEKDLLEGFKELLKSIDNFPTNLTELKRVVSSAITDEKYRRIQEYEMSVTRCIIEESDLNKLAAIRQIDAIAWKKDLLSGRFKKSVESVRPYVCEKCWAEYRIEEINNQKKRDEQAAIQRREADKKAAELRKRNEIAEYINSRGQKGYATPSQAFYLLRDVITKHDHEQLAAIPYKSFLNSQYWFVVRRYVLWKNDFKCNLCSKKTSLQVHHRHYQNRGKEVLTWKDDLIVLCSHCHAKQHDKLAQYAEH